MSRLIKHMGRIIGSRVENPIDALEGPLETGRIGSIPLKLLHGQPFQIESWSHPSRKSPHLMACFKKFPNNMVANDARGSDDESSHKESPYHTGPKLSPSPLFPKIFHVIPASLWLKPYLTKYGKVTWC